MADPLSITTGVLSLLGVTWTVATELKKFHDDVSIVNKTVADLEQDVEGLTRVLESMRDTFETITAEHGSGTGHVASHWANLARSIDDGKVMLQRLSEQVGEINKNKSFLDGPRKQLRLNMAQDKLANYRIHIQSYRDGLQLSLQTIILWNQVSYQKSADQVLPNLNDLHQDVRRIAMDLNQRIEDLQAMVQTPQDEAEVISMNNLRECVRSAASIVSSASTIVASQMGETKLPAVPASDFGDVFPIEQNLAIRRWMESRTVYQYSEAGSQVPPHSIADVSGLGESEDASDSDSDLETEITSILLEDGKRKMAAGELKASERMLKNCMTRLAAMRGGGKESPAHYKKQVEVVSHLFDIYQVQNNPREAQRMLQQRLGIKERVIGKKDSAFLADVLLLARLMQSQGDVLEAQLHARRALKGFKKSGENAKVKECLVLLVELCHGNEDDKEAYSVMLLRIDGDAASRETTPMDDSSMGFTTLSSDPRGVTGTAEDSQVISLALEQNSATIKIADPKAAQCMDEKKSMQQRNVSIEDVEQETVHNMNEYRSTPSLVRESSTAGPTNEPGPAPHVFISGDNTHVEPTILAPTEIKSDARSSNSTSDETIDAEVPTGTEEGSASLVKRTSAAERVDVRHATQSHSAIVPQEQEAVLESVHAALNRDENSVIPRTQPASPANEMETSIGAQETLSSSKPNISRVNSLRVSYGYFRRASDSESLWTPGWFHIAPDTNSLICVHDPAFESGTRPENVSSEILVPDLQGADVQRRIDGDLLFVEISLPHLGIEVNIRPQDQSEFTRWYDALLEDSFDLRARRQRAAEPESSNVVKRSQAATITKGDHATKDVPSLLINDAQISDDHYPSSTRRASPPKVLTKSLSWQDLGLGIDRPDAPGPSQYDASMPMGPQRSARGGILNQTSVDSSKFHDYAFVGSDTETITHSNDSTVHELDAASTSRSTTPSTDAALSHWQQRRFQELNAENLAKVAGQAALQQNSSTQDLSNASAASVADTPSTPRVPNKLPKRPPQPPAADIRRKVVVVGSSTTGKTALITRRIKGVFAENIAPTVFENYVTDLVVDGKYMELAVWDTAGLMDYDRLGPLSYPDSHGVLICFSIGDPSSLEAVANQWIKEVQHFCKGVPIILVGCQKDLRGDPGQIEALVTREEAWAVRAQIGARAYIECSAKTGEGIDDLFGHAGSLIMPYSYKRGKLVPDGEPVHRRMRSMFKLFGSSSA